MDNTTLLDEFISCMDKEIAYKKKKSIAKPLLIHDGDVYTEINGGVIYKFEGFTANIMSDSPGVLILNLGQVNEGRFEATVLGVEDEILTLQVLGEGLPEDIKKAHLIADQTKLMESVRETIIKISTGEERVPRILGDKAFGLMSISTNQVPCNKKTDQMNSSQRYAVGMSLGSDVSFIWGPPGTGKSETLAAIAEEMIVRGKTVLIAAHTNEAVDGLMEKVINLFKPEEIEEGKVMRWRVTGSELLVHITPDAIMKRKAAKLNEKILLLTGEREKLNGQKAELQDKLAEHRNTLEDFNSLRYRKGSEEYDIAKVAAVAIKNIEKDIASLAEEDKKISDSITKTQEEIEKLKGAEYELLKNASVVGTTLTSATINQQLRSRTFHTVIIDEVSNAPCPCLYAACTLGTDKAVLCGDFYQLSPISELKNLKWINKSIFDNCGITAKVCKGENLKELSVLDTQYRTHPVIADSILGVVYRGRLRSGLGREDEKFYAQHLDPFPGNPCTLIDTSRAGRLEKWCEVTGSKSWLCNKSAELAVQLTVQAAQSGIKSIGIITPYTAQASRIKKEIRKLKLRFPACKIEAATVHKYQGREMDMIIFDLVDGPGKPELAPFLREGHGTEAMRLINVATTRARGKLVVIANVDFIEEKLANRQDAILYQWIQYLKGTRHLYF